ncbi:MAG: hypothetical protein HY000_21010 [Planctomycetes bacterium]|nr:hypothetical protein [Planctomycetota bacterium]
MTNTRKREKKVEKVEKKKGSRGQQWSEPTPPKRTPKTRTVEDQGDVFASGAEGNAKELEEYRHSGTPLGSDPRE